MVSISQISAVSGGRNLSAGVALVSPRLSPLARHPASSMTGYCSLVMPGCETWLSSIISKACGLLVDCIFDPLREAFA